MEPAAPPGATFEGPEKTLEIDFVPSVEAVSVEAAPTATSDRAATTTLSASSCTDVFSRTGLRAISRATLDSLLTAAQCCILSHASNKFFDSYVLSESSLFVYPYKMLIKTCGTTTLLRLLPPLLVETRQRGMELEWVGYMRKNFSFPRLQLFPHGGFGEEIRYLEEEVGLSAGEAHALGPLNADHWNAFVYDNCDRPMSESTDRNLNMMMYDIDPIVARHFWKNSGGPDGSGKPQDANDVTMFSGIRDLLPTAKIQAHLFEPCGYSMNGMLFESFYTIHVTPEEGCSYVSFETNVRMSNYEALVKNVLEVFRPKRFTMTMVADEGALQQMHRHPIEVRQFDVQWRAVGKRGAAAAAKVAGNKVVGNNGGGKGEAGAKVSPSGGTARKTMRWLRTARSETTFADDYCFMMGNWTMRVVEGEVAISSRSASPAGVSIGGAVMVPSQSCSKRPVSAVRGGGERAEYGGTRGHKPGGETADIVHSTGLGGVIRPSVITKRRKINNGSATKLRAHSFG